jgi:SAM-dependent methyltransferase
MSLDAFFSHAALRLERLCAAWPLGAQHRCCVCSRKVRRFLPYRASWPDAPAVLEREDVIGSDLSNFECPACGCHDRERHLLLYLQACGLLQSMRGARVLHCAPEQHLRRLIAEVQPREYVLGDLYPSQPGVQRIDLEDISFPDGHFDVVIANHVLEHVSDDARALSEILRVLRPGGQAVLQTPFAARLPHKVEGQPHETGAQRLQAYGQEDHCRLYGADLAAFIAAQGFESRVATHAELLPGTDARQAGVNAREPLLLFVKPGRA